MKTSLVLLLAALAGVAGASARQQVRDAAPVVAGAGTISGRVFVDGPAGAARQPARRVRVTLTELARTMPGQTTTTDDAGAFSFTGLPAGRFEIQSFKNAYLRSSYGASRPERPGTPIVLKAGEAVTNVSMTIARGGVISGILRDPRGRPVPGINVRVLRLGYNALTGERTLGAPSSGASTTTDDRGRYRAYGLPPGGYYVAVPGNDAGRSGGPGGADDLRQVTSEEVRRILQQPSGMAGGTPASARPAPPPPPPVRVNYAPVFHPGVTDIGAATTIALGLGEERTDADVTIQLVPTASIKGTITSSSGGALPAGLSIGLVPAGPFAELLAGAGIRGPSSQLRPDGTYVIGGVAPGRYIVKAQIGRGRLGAADAPVQWAAAEVTMAGQDLDVPLVLQPGMQITGRVVFEG
ncbi:MAG TPA: carboxypeptidase-like regulatory domain-containing protein, partial [Vicinamibacterales bacterium]|nr:carboxypeptidase-like regulatory domain-containing protein [Vicinamibacterales bacterium]